MTKRRDPAARVTEAPTPAAPSATGADHGWRAGYSSRRNSNPTAFGQSDASLTRAWGRVQRAANKNVT